MTDPLFCCFRCRWGGHESSPPAAAAELWALGAEGAARHRGLWKCHKMAKQGIQLHILLAYCYIFENLISLGHNRQERGCLNNKLLHWQDNYTCPAEVSGKPSALTSADQILKLRFCLEGNSHFKMESEMKVHLCVSLFVFSKDLRWGKLPQPAEAKLPCSSYSESSCKQYNDRGGGLAVGYKLNSSFS